MLLHAYKTRMLSIKLMLQDSTISATRQAVRLAKGGHGPTVKHPRDHILDDSHLVSL